MFTIGITKGRWKHDGDRAAAVPRTTTNKNQPLWRVMPEFIRGFRATSRWACVTCVTPSTRIYRESDIARLTTEMYLSGDEPVMKPAERLRADGAQPIDRVPIDDLEAG